MAEDEAPSREELLDNTPEAVAMRRTREARARAAQPAEPRPPRSMRRRLIVGGVLGLAAAARVLGRSGRPSRR